MPENYQPLENEAHAIHIIDEDVHRFYVGQSMFKLGYLIEGIKCKLIDVSHNDLKKENSHNNRKKWINDGVDVEVLKVGGLGWQKGKLKLKVTVEFCPEESSLN
ncbi:KGK domain-containing protein [Geminocystis sp. CENA526]|uniref:KGK domain-containing protein n=1 Tax=Geminocystis sp. CENA526 TaxID=1355871 RepID=UPI003D6E2AF8